MADWPPPDIRHVLRSIDRKALTEWISEELGETPKTRTAAILLALKAGPVFRKLYRENLICGHAAVTWFLAGKPPSASRVQNVFHIESHNQALGENPYGVVWSDLKSSPKCLRIAYPDGIDIDANLNAVEKRGFATMIWRSDLSSDEQHVLEVHCRSPKIKKAVLPALQEMGITYDTLQVLDFRDNRHARKIREELGGTLVKATALVNEPDAVDDRVEFNARLGKDLSDPASGFKDYAEYPGRGRTFHAAEMKVTISQRDFSVQLADASPESTKLFFEEAQKIGDWIPFP